ncbi:hypothetical protein GF337_00455 [candidate division KSB1 bacterium]|nr:hypothetical protein [candidate division KSB1 bacterium]
MPKVKVMEFKTVQRIANLLAKPFAGDLLKLLVNYQDISASEAATRLDLHIKTAQDFLEELTALEITAKREVYERKRPYYRYELRKYEFTIDVKLSELADSSMGSDEKIDSKIRERKNANAVFTVARGGDFLSSITILLGKGRHKRERKISLNLPQGTFLYHLPFPTAEPLPIREIIQQSGVEERHQMEILDIVELLIEYGVIEVKE